METDEPLLDMAQRRVREGAAHVRQQGELVQHLEEIRSPLLEEATALLSQFASSEEDHQRHLAEIEAEIQAGRRQPDGTLLPLTR